MPIPCDPGILTRLRGSDSLKGSAGLGGFAYAVDTTVPYLATAIHAGHAVRDDLLPLMQIDAAARYLEEDPETDAMIRSAESAVWGLDSRSEYDLNRPREEALPLTPERFWGLQVYARQPDAAMNRASLAKYDQFYAFMGAWARTTLERFGVCVVYDIHSYNVGRQIKNGIAEPPVFNLGTAGIDRIRWTAAVDGWLERLSTITIDGADTTVAENRVFQGKGELCRRLSAWDPRILVLPTEVAKVYMAEQSGKVYHQAVSDLQQGFRRAMQAHSRMVLEKYGREAIR